MRAVKFAQLLFLAIALFPISATAADRSAKFAQAATTRFDGLWNALMKSDEPPCPDTFEYIITIRNGELSGTVPGNIDNFDLTGRVMADGSLKDTEASSSERRMTFEGKFSETVAEGKFTAFGVTSDCGGTFKFTRQK